MIPGIEQLVERFGLVAVFVGCVAEGETAALLAGFLAHQGTFAPAAAWVTVFFGAFIGDVGFFLAGRRLGETAFIARAREKPGFIHLLSLAERHPAAFVLLNRYVYGTRLAGSIAVGMTALPVTAFMALNALSSAIWATLFCAAGWVFGLGFEQALERKLAGHERLLTIFAIAVAGAAVALLWWRYGRRRADGRP